MQSGTGDETGRVNLAMAKTKTIAVLYVEVCCHQNNEIGVDHPESVDTKDTCLRHKPVLFYAELHNSV